MMNITDHERTELISEARVFALASPILLPILDKRKKDALGRLMQAHRSGRTDTQTLVAELAVLTDIENELKQKEAMYRTLEEQHVTRSRK